MMPVTARAIYIKKEASEDPRSMARIERMMPFIKYDGEVQIIDDAGLNQLLLDEQKTWCRHGQKGNSIEPVVIFNQFLYGHSAELRAEREEKYPVLFKSGGPSKYAGYGGFDWRNSGSEEHRKLTGTVCQPAYALHSFWGCHFRCAYCNLGHIAHVYVNIEDWREHILESFNDMEKSPGQNLFQWDNGSDIVCWEPEYGGTKMLIDLFAQQADKYLELYVGKSDYVDFLLDYDHKGHTTCCWSICTETQAKVAEPRAATMTRRIDSIRKCQEAGYPVRVRLSPMIPITGWEKETREMLQYLFEQTKPEMITMEPLRYYTYDGLLNDYAPGFIDPEFLEGMRLQEEEEKIANEGKPIAHHRRQFPAELVHKMYQVVFDESYRLSPNTPIAFCREKRTTWDHFEKELTRCGQDPDNYVCNCGPRSGCTDPRILKAVQ